MKKTVLILLALLNILLAVAQIRGNSIVVTVEPDHQDWNYRVGETARFTVEVRRSGTLVHDVSITYAAGPEMYQDVRKTVTLKDGTLRLTGKMGEPGFYRVDVTAHVDGKEYRGACAAAFSPELLQPSTVMPPDFRSFWEKSIEEARQTPLEPTRRLLPERCTKDVNVYEVSFQNMRWNARTYGILCVPVSRGHAHGANTARYPALLRVPGAGVRPYTGDVWTASQGIITLEIGIHGIPVTMEQKVYDDLANGALNGYWNYSIDHRDQSYYKRVVLGCLRAIDYIEQYTPWNGQQLGVTGSSQGGFLSLATAGLDQRVTCYAPVHAALCDHTNSLKGKACGWPHYFYWNKGKGQEQQIETSRYYDGVNFARMITNKQRGWFSFGYCDDVVPPTTAWATYNTVKGPKELSPYQATWHFWFQEQWDEWESWLLKALKTSRSEQLAERLQTLQLRGYMMGHQDDPMYGVTWDGTYRGEHAEMGRSDVLATVGDYPAVMGFDLGGIEMGDTKNLDSVPFSRIRDELIAHHVRGGIVTLSWHPRNPLTTGDKGGSFPQGSAWDVNDGTVVRSVLKGGSQHGRFLTWMQRVGDFIATLKTQDGQPIPIIFRPWHENNGSWFWWGQKLCSDSEFRSLWNMLQDYLTDECGFDNLLWCYSPNLDGSWTEERFLQRYPGNNRVTLIGEDAYQWGTEQDFKTALAADLNFLTAFAKKNGKLLAMTECGLKNMTDATWWTRVLKPVMDQYPLSYFLLWRNYKKEYFGPSPELPCAADFRKLYEAKNTLFLKDIKEK